MLRIASVLLLHLAMLPSALLLADATTDYESLFGAEAARVQASPSTKDDAVLAAKLLKTAQQAAHDRTLQALLCEKAYQFGIAGPDGYATALQAMELLATVLPDKTALWRERTRRVHQLRILRGSPDEKATARRALVELLVADGDALADSGNRGEALTAYRQAADVAATFDRNEARRIQEKVRQSVALQQASLRLESLKARLRQNR